jgi:Ca-activated chloride channel family protein
MARAGHGAAEFIHPGERLEAKIVRQFARILSPALTDVRVEWAGVRATTVPETMPPIFANQPVRAYAWLEELVAGTVTLRANGPNRPLSWSLDIDPAAVVSGRVVGTLAARARIREIEEGAQWQPSRGSRQRERRDERAVGDIVRLAMQYGLASRETSWVVVEKRDVATTEPAVLRRVPIAIASGWGGNDDALSIGYLDAASSVGRIARDITGEFSLDRSVLSAPQRRVLGSAPVSRSLLSRVADRWFPSRRTPLSQPTDSERSFDRVIALQRADGSWELDEALLVACGFQLEQRRVLEAFIPVAAQEEGRRAMATAIALTFLRRRAAADRAEWELLARKAERWLDRLAVAPNGGGTWLDAASAVYDRAQTG